MLLLRREVRKRNKAYRQALAILGKLNDRKGYVRVCLALARTYARAEVRGGASSTEARKILLQGLTYLGEEADCLEAASVYAWLAGLHSAMDEWDEALAWAEKAMEVGSKTGNHFAVAEALAMKGSFLTDTGKIDEGLSLWQQALDLAVKHEDYDTVAYQNVMCDLLSNLAYYTYPRCLAKAKELAVQHLEHHERRKRRIWRSGRVLYPIVLRFSIR